MPSKNIKNGTKVKVAGKEGTVMECADKVKVKFDDGNFGFFEPGVVEPVVYETRLKQGTIEPMATQEDPLAQPVKKEIGDYVCPRCGSGFNTREELYTHIETKHDVKR